MNRKFIGIAAFAIISIGSAVLMRYFVWEPVDIGERDNCQVVVSIMESGELRVDDEIVSLERLVAEVRALVDKRPHCGALVNVELESRAKQVVEVVNLLERSGIEVTLGQQ